MILKVGYVGLDWIHLSEERNVVNTVMNYFYFFLFFIFFVVTPCMMSSYSIIIPTNALI